MENYSEYKPKRFFFIYTLLAYACLPVARRERERESPTGIVNESGMGLC